MEDKKKEPNIEKLVLEAKKVYQEFLKKMEDLEKERKKLFEQTVKKIDEKKIQEIKTSLNI